MQKVARTASMLVPFFLLISAKLLTVDTQLPIFFYVDMHILGTVLFIVVVVVVKVTSPHSFILFQPLSGKKAIFRRVPGGPFWAIFVM